MFLASAEFRRETLVKIAEYCAEKECSTCILNEYFRSCNFEEMHKECLEIAMELIGEERNENIK